MTDENKNDKIPRRNFLGKAAFGAAALGATAAGGLYWRGKEEKSEPPMLEELLKSEAIIKNDRDLQETPAQKYNEAYRAFYTATQDALPKLFDRINEKRDMAKWHEIDMVFQPAALISENFKDRIKPEGQCYFAFKDIPEAEKADLPDLVKAFDSYVALCRIQNKISSSDAKRAQLPELPAGEELTKWLSERYDDLYLPALFTGDDIAPLLARIVNAGCAGFGVKPHFSDKEPKNVESPEPTLNLREDKPFAYELPYGIKLSVTVKKPNMKLARQDFSPPPVTDGHSR